MTQAGLDLEAIRKREAKHTHPTDHGPNVWDDRRKLLAEVDRLNQRLAVVTEQRDHYRDGAAKVEDDLELEVIALRDSAAEAGNDALWQQFATAASVIDAVRRARDEHDE